MATTTPQRKTPQDRKPRATTVKVQPKFDIEADDEDEQLIPIRLVGEMYDVIAPKASLALRMGLQAGLSEMTLEDAQEAINGIYRWIDKAFGERAQEIHARLDDPDDKLDIKHINRLMVALAEKASSNPTT